MAGETARSIFDLANTEPLALFEKKANMGRVRTKTVKKAARQIVEKYYSKLTLDFQINKKISEEVAVIPSKRLRNKIAGFITHLMRRIQKGPVRGISLKLQEEERERRMEFIPEHSEIDVETIPVDQDTMDMLKELDMEGLGDKIKIVARPAVQRPQTFNPRFGGNRN
uniref:40S ribosomal protein S17 n=1 Tax=Chromera velia CCMP2878 TaxID=1169474 RepID=A0A0G4HDL3_9ALVE|eukprot:Cvel_26551.t1-p1 / transcript=Cvel_26551.t1 / gene=Cvel_26551 / organism=Chromera_velia_CCMP2878 / gene_product=40S ribosomal protein S17, putative / transcript_product=40S ribosomal protein S17, putative / location=Cvel_scaffold3177:4508-6926(+) / protein_length=167 / sequence_SO=supercontig / SO=protein_coding / is_pseudo=false